MIAAMQARLAKTYKVTTWHRATNMFIYTLSFAASISLIRIASTILKVMTERILAIYAAVIILSVDGPEINFNV
jgi:hypothetical protein